MFCLGANNQSFVYLGVNLVLCANSGRSPYPSVGLATLAKFLYRKISCSDECVRARESQCLTDQKDFLRLTADNLEGEEQVITGWMTLLLKTFSNFISPTGQSSKSFRVLYRNLNTWPTWQPQLWLFPPDTPHDLVFQREVLLCLILSRPWDSVGHTVGT